MANQSDYYELLQVHPRASLLMIKKAYRTLLLESGIHPDQGGDAAAARRLNEAYETLCDPERRKAYDASLQSVGERTVYLAICPHCGTCNRVKDAREVGDARSPLRCGKCRKPLAATRTDRPAWHLPELADLPRGWVTAILALGMIGCVLAIAWRFPYGRLAALRWGSFADSFARAKVLEGRGQLGAAAQVYQGVIHQDPGSALAHQQLGKILEQQHLYARAFKEYADAAALMPDSAYVQFLLGRTLVALSRYPEAEQALQRSIQLDGSDPEALSALANLEVQTGRFDEAAGTFRRVLALSPRDAALWGDLGMVYQLEHEDAQAMAAYRKALAIDPRQRDSIIALGSLYEDAGNLDAALTEFQRASILRYEDPDLHFKLGEVQRMLGNAPAAIIEYRLCVAQATEAPLLQKRAMQALNTLGARS